MKTPYLIKNGQRTCIGILQMINKQHMKKLLNMTNQGNLREKSQMIQLLNSLMIVTIKKKTQVVTSACWQGYGGRQRLTLVGT